MSAYCSFSFTHTYSFSVDTMVKDVPHPWINSMFSINPISLPVDWVAKMKDFPTMLLEKETYWLRGSNIYFIFMWLVWNTYIIFPWKWLHEFSWSCSSNSISRIHRFRNQCHRQLMNDLLMVWLLIHTILGIVWWNLLCLMAVRKLDVIYKVEEFWADAGMFFLLSSQHRWMGCTLPDFSQHPYLNHKIPPFGEPYDCR